MASAATQARAQGQLSYQPFSTFLKEQEALFMACLASSICVLLCAIGASCYCLNEHPTIIRSFPHDNGTNLPITIAVGSHTSHRLVSNILKILLHEVVGYRDVRLVPLQRYFDAEHVPSDIDSVCHDESILSSSCWTGNGMGTVPHFMINLETWVAVDQAGRGLLAGNQTLDVGMLGPLGRYGIYVSRTAYDELWREQQLLLSDVLALRRLDVARKLSLAGLEAQVNRYVRGFRQSASTGSTSNSFSPCDDARAGCVNHTYVPALCQSNDCAMLLVSDVDYSAVALKQLVDGLQLRVKIVWLGHRLKDFFVNVALPRNASVLILDRFPSTLTVRPEAFKRMALPECAALDMFSPKLSGVFGTAGHAPNASTGCEFDLHEIHKVIWKQLALREPVVHDLVQSMRWSASDYSSLLRAYGSCEYIRHRSNHTDMSIVQTCPMFANKSIAVQREMLHDLDEHFACYWIQEHNNTWQRWMPAEGTRKPKLYIGGMFPISPGAWSQPNIIPAAVLAIELINRNKTILPEFELELIVKDSGCRSELSLKAFIEHIMDSVRFRELVGILGPACPDTALTLASVAKYYNLPMITYSVETIVNPEDRNISYPYFFRTVPQINEYAYVYTELFKNFSWSHVATIVDDRTREFHMYHIILHNKLRDNHIKADPQIKIPTPKPSSASAGQEIAKHLEDIKKSKTHVIIADMYEQTARLVMCEAFKLKMTAAEGYVWFLPGMFGFDWHDTKHYNEYSQESVNCTSEELRAAIKGYFSLSHAFFDSDSKFIIGDMTVATWKSEYSKRLKQFVHSSGIQMPNYVSDFGGYAYDAVWSFALALSSLNKENPSYLREIHSNQSIRRLVQLLYNTTFDGASGPIEFTQDGDRHGIVHIKQYVTYASESLSFEPTIVGVWKPELNKEQHSDIMELHPELIVWSTGSMPRDSVTTMDPGLREPGCSVESFRQALGVSCEVAIAVAFVIGFVLLLVFVLSVVTVIKRRYDREMRKTQERLEQLGLMVDMNGPPRWLNLDEWEVPREYVVLNRKLGEGAYGTVYGGEARGLEGRVMGVGLTDWMPVAVKTLKAGSSPEEKLDFLSEAETMKKFEHKNIVKLLGVCTKGEPAYAIMEFMLHGDLKTFLLSRRHMVYEDSREAEDVTPSSLTKMAVDIISGLRYLHERQFVHRDLACRNCLVSASKVVKIGDFGLARPLYNHDYYKFTRKGRLPVRWMAPESLTDGVFTYRSDCWSFGIVLYEIVTFGSFPYQGLSNSQVLDYVKNGSTLKVPLECTDEMKALLFRCWAFNAENRPTSESIYNILLSNSELLQPLIASPNAAAMPEYESAEMDLSPQPLVTRPLLSPGGTMPVPLAVLTTGTASRRPPLQRPSSSLSSVELFRKSRNSSESTKFKAKRKSSNSLMDGIFSFGGVPSSPDCVPRSPSVGTLHPSSPTPALQTDGPPSPAFAFPAVAEESGREDYTTDRILAYCASSSCASYKIPSGGAAVGVRCTDTHHSQPLLSQPS